MEIIDKIAIFVRLDGKSIIEDPLSKIPAVRINYSNGSYRYIIVSCFPVFSFASETIEIGCDEFMCNVPGFSNPVPVNDTEDKVFPMGKMIIDNTRHVFATGQNAGQFTDQPVDGENVITNFQFWFGYLKNVVVVPVQNQILFYAG